MKKSVILIIGIIYIVSVVIVGFIGLQMRVYNPTVYVSDIVCTVANFTPVDIDQSIKDKYGWDYYYLLPISGNSITIEVRCRVIPEDATNALVDFYMDASDSNDLTLTYDNNIASITFKNDGAYKITAKSSDGTNVEKVMMFVTYSE
ncbi:MAG: hypothetical protein J1F31_01185 [Erysipelotrichales bacterium]|nr:hypothetical protein [Erysipelotrichales bacterium]